MDDGEREQHAQEIETLKESHADEIKSLGEEIDGLKDRNRDLEDAITEIYNIAKRV